jgi:nicotinate-nucleotide--dimethylbenzimidazole phosphoribosyltransferase
MSSVDARTATAPPPSSTLAAQAQRAMDQKTKPLGSLGRLEEIAVRLAVLQGTLAPSADPARAVVFAGDHGIAREGVSAYPPQVTREMMRNFTAGGAAINVIGRSVGATLEVVDVGVDADLADVPGIVHAKVERSTRSITTEPAMTAEQCDAAMAAGHDAVRRAAGDGVRVLALGEMGIGNTAVASAVLSALTGEPPERTVGRGTGVDDARLILKRDAVRRALVRHRAQARHPDEAREILASLGGFELAAIAGAAIAAAEHRVAVVADGFISTVAVLAALRIAPSIAPALFYAHRSAELGHAIALDAAGGVALLDLGMRLGEGSGAALAIPVLRAAARVMCEMATFEQARVSTAT